AFAYTIALTRNNTFVNPIFPVGGSEFSISAKVTPPYSLLNDVDYANLGDQEEYQRKISGRLVNANDQPISTHGGEPVPDIAKIGQEKIKWQEFYKIKFKGAWYTSLINKFVIKT